MKRNILPILTDTVLKNLLDIFSGTLSTEFSRVRAAFRKAAGEEMAKYYVIDGGSGERKMVMAATIFSLAGT